MTSYEFYVCKYGGKAIQPDEWRTAYADADALIQRYERLYRVGYPTDSARDTAVCAIADAQRRFADVQSGAVAAPASVTIGSVKDWHVDYTDQVPSCGAVFPQGLQEIERSTYITGAVCVTNQSNFGLYFTFAKSAGDDEGAKINADWVNGFQHWVQEQSAHGLAPNFGDAEEPVIARAQNGVLYEAEAEGTATYMVVLSLRYTKTYESEDFA